MSQAFDVPKTFIPQGAAEEDGRLFGTEGGERFTSYAMKGRKDLQKAQENISNNVNIISASLFSLGNNIEGGAGKVLTSMGNIVTGVQAMSSGFDLILKGGPLNIFAGVLSGLAGLFGMFEKEENNLRPLNNELEKVSDSTEKATNSLKDMSQMLFNISDAVNVDILRARTYAKFSQGGTVNGQINVVVSDTSGKVLNRSVSKINSQTGTMEGV